MGQNEIIEFLMRERASGNHKYWSVRELTKEIDSTMFNIYKAMNQLYNFGFCEIKIPKGKSQLYFRRKFRIKKKYVIKRKSKN